MKIASLVSGGVDSSVTIPLLVSWGYKPDIFYIRIGKENRPGFMDCSSEEDIEISSYIAHKYRLNMEIIDLHDAYWSTVISYTLETVRKGLTPNPDVMCNRLIKFGAFEEQAGHAYDYITTGHYADTMIHEGKKYLLTSSDKVKDQTYFLGRIRYSQLRKLWFPLGQLKDKTEVRRLAEEMNLPSAQRRDSQGICFLGKVNYRDFIREHVGEQPGEIRELETDRVIGTHRGYWFHTIGQRKGLGLGQGPWFVTGKDVQGNIIYVSRGYDPQSQYGDFVLLQDFLFITENPFEDRDADYPVAFKIRHSPEFHKGRLSFSPTGVCIKASEPISGIAPGQFGVVYTPDEKTCLGSGIIAEQ
ncbi:MAG: tRNA 2-thiouridine(34) synthase MnmA [Bacteroidales bacterium]